MSYNRKNCFSVLEFSHSLSIVGNYLVKVAADGHVVYKWYHRLFLEAARSYFLGDKPFTDSLHRDLANYFNGR